MLIMSTVTSRTRTITVRLPEALADEIETESRKRGVSKSDVVRERLERAREGTELPPQLEDIADLIGSIDDDLPADLSARKKHYLRVYGFGRNRSR
jgi:Arc/MetJ-type ribon-helix-helix transcriptional regulator